MAGIRKTRSFTPKDPAGCSESSDLRGEGELGGAMERGVTEGRTWQGRSRPHTEVILVQIFLLIHFSNGLANLLDMEKLEL